MVRLLLGLIKGALAGVLVGFGVTKLGIGTGALSWLAYAATGGLVGVVCGKPPWRHETFWTPLLKALVGALVGLGLAFLGRKFLGGVPVPGALVSPLGLPDGQTLAQVPAALATLIGAVYGALIELDDGGSSGGSKSARPATAKR
jgi:hypothetical protein